MRFLRVRGPSGWPLLPNVMARPRKARVGVARCGANKTMKTVFTTGEAAKICKVSQQTVIRCFDNGQLRGYRVPGTRFRRIPRESLYRFMKDNGIPTDVLERDTRKILIVDNNTELVSLI